VDLITALSVRRERQKLMGNLMWSELMRRKEHLMTERVTDDVSLFFCQFKFVFEFLRDFEEKNDLS
jgi:hypothetical protein